MKIFELNLNVFQLLLLFSLLDFYRGGILIFTFFARFRERIIFRDCLAEHRGLQCEAIGHLHFVPHYHACCVKLVLILLEEAGLPVENLLYTGEDLGKQSCLGPRK